MNEEQALDLLGRLAGRFTPGDLDHTLEQITAAARALSIEFGDPNAQQAAERAKAIAS